MPTTQRNGLLFDAATGLRVGYTDLHGKDQFDAGTVFLTAAAFAALPLATRISYAGSAVIDPASPYSVLGVVDGSGNLGAPAFGGDGIAASSANLTATVGAAGALTGAYYYAVTFVTSLGETAPWPGTATVVNPSTQRVELSSIPLGPAGVTARRIYRTPATPTDPKDYRFLAEISDNTTTAYSDNTVDGSLGSPVRWSATNRGTIKIGAETVGTFSDQSTSLGRGTFAANVGYASTAVGYNALTASTTGRRNAAVGTYALTAVTTGAENTAAGVHAGGGITSAVGNALFGYAVGSATKVLGSFNSLLGAEVCGGTGAATVGQQNTGVGYRALYSINTADNCIGIGSYAGQFANASRQLFIDTQASVRVTIAAAQNEGLVYGEIPNSANVQTQRLNLNGSVRLGSSTTPTVANLPAAAAGLQGCRRYVTDSTVAAATNYGATVAGGGSNCVPVFCTGTAWIIA